MAIPRLYHGICRYHSRLDTGVSVIRYGSIGANDTGVLYNRDTGVSVMLGQV